jgi:hypothetical protein
VKKRKGGGHVFFVVGWNGSHVFALGGNQKDMVNVVTIPRAEIIAYRWPPNIQEPTEYPTLLPYTGPTQQAGSEA